jgi:hypothetical protein
MPDHDEIIRAEIDDAYRAETAAFRAETAAYRGETAARIDAYRAESRAQFERLETLIERLMARFDRQEFAAWLARHFPDLDRLDAEVGAIARHLFGQGGEPSAD